VATNGDVVMSRAESAAVKRQLISEPCLKKEYGTTDSYRHRGEGGIAHSDRKSLESTTITRTPIGHPYLESLCHAGA
jgi:hypothetical protein